MFYTEGKRHFPNRGVLGAYHRFEPGSFNKLIMALTPENFTEHKIVLKCISDLESYREIHPDHFIFSDVIDKAGRQYVDLVQEGGGVLGIALMGYTYVLEKMGIRFLKMAGTSAGAINTMMLAAADKPEKAKTKVVLQHLIDQNLNEFVDGDKDVQDFVKALNSKAGKLKLLFKGAQVIDELKEHQGLNPGNNFEEWLSDSLRGFGIVTTNDLNRRMLDLPPEILKKIYPETSKEGLQKKNHISIIAADITTETKVDFPGMGPLYFEDVNVENPAKFVRASMSVPLFFHPLKIEIPQTSEVKYKWMNDANYHGPHPEEVQFVDGGVLSNFPIDVFHVFDRMPRRPTFGVKLGFDRHNYNDAKSMDLLKLVFSCFNAARLMSDRDFINRNPDFRELVASVDISGFNWLNFNLSDDKKIALFVQGAITARNFLKEFNWKKYKETRKNKSLSAIASVDLGLKIPKLLAKAERVRRIPITKGAEQEKLTQRLQFLTDDEKFDVLWIDDNSHGEWDMKKHEVKLIKELVGSIDYVGSSDAALKRLQNPEKTYELIISDINRAGKKDEGIHFLKDLMVSKDAIGLTEIPPFIYYITEYDPSRGTPAYAFGITNEPAELIHLVADVYQRKAQTIDTKKEDIVLKEELNDISAEIKGGKLKLEE